MFTYAHFCEDLLPMGSTITYQQGEGETTNYRMDGNVHIEERFAANDSASVSETFLVKWSVKTYARSVTSYARTTSYSYSDSAGNTGAYNNGTSSGSVALGAANSSGVDSHTFTCPATQTYSFTTQYFSNTATTVSGSASATRTTTGSQTLTMNNVTTRVPAPIPSVAKETRWFLGRELPFATDPSGLRRVGLGYGLGEVGTITGSRTVSSLLTGAQTYNSTRLSTSASSDAQHIVRTIYNTSSMGVGRAVAGRRKYQGFALFNTEGTSGTAMSWDSINQMLDPSIAPDFFAFVSIGSQIIYRRIFTDLEASVAGSRYSVDGSSALLAWSYISSSWKLFATKTNDSSSTTTEISLLSSVSAPTTTLAATTQIGLTTAILGPLVPFTASSFGDITVTQSAAAGFPGSSRTFVLMSGSGTSGAASSSSTTRAASTSFSFFNGTANSNLPFYASVPAISVGTATGYGFFIDDSDVTIYQNSKWNEASRGDPVSLIE